MYIFFVIEANHVSQIVRTKDEAPLHILLMPDTIKFVRDVLQREI